MKQSYKVAIGDVKFSKKTTISIEIKGNLSDEQKLDLLEFAQSDGFMQLASAQRDIEDYEPKHVGLAYSVKGGEVKVNSEQLEIDDVIEEEPKELNWLEQEELIAEQEAAKELDELSDDEKEIQSMRSEAEDEQEEDELSDELE